MTDAKDYRKSFHESVLTIAPQYGLTGGRKLTFTLSLDNWELLF